MKNEQPKKTIDDVAKSGIQSLEGDDAGQLQGGFSELTSALEKDASSINISKCYCGTTPPATN